jgi:tRNA 2-selenouridine synthase
MVHQLSIEAFLGAASAYNVIDVRSEKEFAEGHIPGAINIPILEDEERKIVGTIYKQNSRQAAVYKGLELSGPHLSERLRRGVKHSKENKILVHCWRGGMRSEFYAFLLHYFGIEPHLLIGGYKSYRTEVHRSFDRKLNFVVLAGKTGSAKTEILSQLKDRGEQIIDLEFLAKHRGSSFGALAYEEKTSQEQFENDLFEVIRALDHTKRVWIEDEGRTIGDKVVPEGVWSQALEAPRMVIERSFDERLDQIVKDYSCFNKTDLKVSMQRIGKRLGPQHVKRALELLDENEYYSAFEIALKYYDKAYDFQLSRVELEKRTIVNARGLSITEIADFLKKL